MNPNTYGLDKSILQKERKLKRRADRIRNLDQIAAYYAAHMRIEVIAEKVGLTPKTVQAYLSQAKSRFKNVGAEQLQEIIADEVNEINQVDTRAWQIFSDPKAKPIERIAALELILKSHDRRAKIFGINAPEKREHSGKVEIGAPFDPSTLSPEMTAAYRLIMYGEEIEAAPALLDEAVQ
jgi:hypothetical protein